MAYNTGNPIGSSDFRDLSDNAVNFDKYSNGPDPAYPNRLGELKLSIEGMNQEFNNAQEGRETAFDALLAASAFYFLADYGPGINITSRSQYVIRDGVAYRLAPAATLPYTTTGNWALESANFTPISSDDILRQDLSDLTDPMSGAALVARSLRHIDSVSELRSIDGQYNGEVVYLRGRTTADYIGAGNVVWVTPLTLTDDDGTVFGSAATGRWVRLGTDYLVDAGWFGVGNDGSDFTTQLQNAINFAAAAVSDSQGMTVRLPRGTIGITSPILLPNRVAVAGANGRGTTVKPLAGFTGSYMFSATNGTSSMFGSRLEDLHIDARGFNMSAVVYSTAWQETCGMTRVLIQFDGTTPIGFLYETGNGGAALLKLRDIEIFSNSTATSRDAIRVKQVSLVGGFLLIVENSTFAGSATNPLTRGINMVNDSLLVNSLHLEYCLIGVLSQGAGNLDVNSMTGSGNAVTDMVAVGSGYTGKVNLRSMLPNGATGSIFTSAVTGQVIAASGQRVASFTYPQPAFNAHVSAQIADVTGNGTEYTVLFNTERFDLSSSFSSGIFTAPESGKYQFSAAVKLTVPATATTCVIKIVTTTKEYYLYRGSLAGIRDGSGTVTLGGSVLADLALGATARVRVTVNGIGADTADVEANETWFTGFKACW